MSNPPRMFSALASASVRDGSMRMLFSFMPAIIILLLAAHAARQELVVFVREARSQTANAVALAHVNETDARLRRALAAHARHEAHASRDDFAEYQTQRALADFGRILLPGGQMALVHPEQAYRLRELKKAADRLFAALESADRSAAAERRESLQALDTLLAAYRDKEARADAWRPEALLREADNTVFIIMWIAAFASMLLLWALLAVRSNQHRRRQAEGALAHTERTLGTAADAVPALIGYADADGCVRYANRMLAERLAGDRRPEGRLLRELLGADAYAAIAGHVAAALAGHTARFLLPASASPPYPNDLQGYLLPHRGEQDDVQGYFLFMMDTAELQALERLKNEFASMVRHELRTPLTAIQGALGLVAGGATGALPEKAHLLVNTALQSCTRLGQLVNDVFDSDAVFSGSMSFSLVPVDAGAAARAAAEQSRQTTAGNVEVEVEAGRISVLADERRLRQVITNLCTNACNFSPAGSTVEVRVERHAGGIRISIADRGPGLPPEVREKLFERYTRQGTTDRSGAGRLGLGLYTAHGMLARMGSALRHRDREGGGTVFYFDLPPAG